MPLTDEQLEHTKNQILEVIRPLDAATAELIITVAFFEAMDAICFVHKDPKTTQESIMKHIAGSFDIWWNQIRPHLPKLGH